MPRREFVTPADFVAGSQFTCSVTFRRRSAANRPSPPSRSGIPAGKGTFTATFKTGKHDDYYVAFGTHKKSSKLFVIDDFLID